MSQIYLIAILTFIFILNSYFIFEDLYLKKWQKEMGLNYYYNYIKGIPIKKKERKKLFKNYNKKIIFNMYAYIILIFFSANMVFKSIVFAFVLSCFGFLYPKFISEKIQKKKETLIDYQLKDALTSLNNSLKAGLSINSALIKCSEDLRKIYISTQEKPILEEFLLIKKDLGLGLSVDDTLRNFSKRVKNENIEDFVNSIILVREKGGNLVEVVNNTTEIINSKIFIKREIKRLTSSKKMESKVITSLPIIVIILLSLLSPEYMAPLVNSSGGKLLVLIGMLLLILNYRIGKKIIDIKI